MTGSEMICTNGLEANKMLDLKLTPDGADDDVSLVFSSFSFLLYFSDWEEELG